MSKMPPSIKLIRSSNLNLEIFLVYFQVGNRQEAYAVTKHNNVTQHLPMHHPLETHYNSIIG
jgi:hypothetical protein